MRPCCISPGLPWVGRSPPPASADMVAKSRPAQNDEPSPLSTTTRTPGSVFRRSPASVNFNHSLSEIFNALWRAGLTITMFEEHRSVPWNALGTAMVDIGGEEFQLREQPERLAASYTLRAVKS